MKKFTLICASAALIASAVCASAQDITVTVDGYPIVFDQSPVIQDGRTLVPMRAIFEALGATVEWDANTRTVTSTRGNIVIEITIDSPFMKVIDYTLELDVPAQIINDRTMVPVRAISEALDCKVVWDGDTQTVSISSNNTVVPPVTEPAASVPEPLVSDPSESEPLPQVPSENNSEMVWIGETGNKYHYEDCRTLKGTKYQITMEEAVAQGKTSCGVCHR